jgi:hypothetical protein
MELVGTPAAPQESVPPPKATRRRQQDTEEWLKRQLNELGDDEKEKGGV